MVNMKKIRNIILYIIGITLTLLYLVYLYSNHNDKFEDVEYSYQGIDYLRFDLAKNKKIAIMDKYISEYDSISSIYDNHIKQYELYTKEYLLYNSMKLKALDELKIKRIKQYNSLK